MTPAVSAPCICGGSSCETVVATCLDCKTAKPVPYQRVPDFEREHSKHAVIVHHRAVSS